MLFVSLQGYGIGFVECGEGMCSFPDGALRVLPDGGVKVGNVSLNLMGGYVSIRGERREGKVSVFSGNGTHIRPLYKSVVLKGENVKAVLSYVGGEVNLQFVFKAGRRPIAGFEVSGGGAPKLAGDGLVIEGAGIKIRLGDLHAFQGSEELTLNVGIEGNIVELSAEGYDPRFPVVIDPVFAVFVAGSRADFGYDLLAAPDGTVYVVGRTQNSSDFAPSRSVFGTSGNYDAFVTRLTGDLTTHLATAIVSGSGDDVARGITLDSTGNIVISGYTTSSDIAPTRTVMGTPGGGYEAFVTRLSADLSTHLATVVLAGSMADYGMKSATAPNGDILVVGYTFSWGSPDFAPSRNLFGTHYVYDVFVSRLSPDLSAHVSTAIVGGSGHDFGLTVTTDTSGAVLVAGYTQASGDYAPTRNTFGTPAGDDAFITALSPDLTTHITTTILASTWGDGINAIEVNSSGQVVVGGWVNNLNDFVPADTFGFCGGGTGTNSFASLLDASLTPIKTVVVCSQFADGCHDVALRGDTVLLSGEADASNTLPDPKVVSGNMGSTDSYVAFFSPDLSTHILTLIIAGSGGEDGMAIDVGSMGDIYTAGTATGSLGDLADVRDTFGTPSPGYQEAYVARVVEPLGREDDLGVSESESGFRCEVKDGVLKVSLPSPGYVGYDIYSHDGRLVHRESAGYLSGGERTLVLPSLPTGVYLLKVRVGNGIKTLKFHNKNGG